MDENEQRMSGREMLNEARHSFMETMKIVEPFIRVKKSMCWHPKEKWRIATVPYLEKRMFRKRSS